MAVHKLCDHNITTAMTGDTIYTSPVYSVQQQVLALLLQAVFTYVASAATSVDCYVQTSIDGGVTWGDVACFEFTTSTLIKTINLSALTPVTTAFAPTDGAMTANTNKDGFLGQLWRVKLKSSGTYGAGTNIKVYGSFKTALVG